MWLDCRPVHSFVTLSVVLFSHSNCVSYCHVTMWLVVTSKCLACVAINTPTCIMVQWCFKEATTEYNIFMYPSSAFEVRVRSMYQRVQPMYQRVCSNNPCTVGYNPCTVGYNQCTVLGTIHVLKGTITRLVFVKTAKTMIQVSYTIGFCGDNINTWPEDPGTQSLDGCVALSCYKRNSPRLWGQRSNAY